jgi:hypothetical protein
MSDEFDEQFDKENEEYKKSLNKITEFLNYFDKGYEVKKWDSGEGIDIIIPCLEDLGDYKFKEYKQIISLTNGGYLTFEKQEKE